MNLLVSVLLLASATSLELFDETATTARGKWNWYPVTLRQQLATVHAEYEVRSGGKHVRLVLMTYENAELMHEGFPHGVLASTEPGRRGSLTYTVRRRDQYAIVVDNREGQQDATVRVHVSLDFAPPREPEATTISPGRQLTVIALSFAFFFGVVTYSARRILRAIRR